MKLETITGNCPSCNSKTTLRYCSKKYNQLTRVQAILYRCNDCQSPYVFRTIKITKLHFQREK